MTKQIFKFELADIVKDTLTGFTGVVECRCQWLNNCNTYGIKSRFLYKGQPIDRHFFDEPQLERVGILDKEIDAHKKKSKKKEKPGGPCASIPNTNR